MIGHALILAARSGRYVIAGRLVIGFASGITCAIVPLYFQKLAPRGMRGIYGAFHQLSLCTGIFCAQLFSFYFCREDNWRIGLGIVIGYLLVHTVALCFVQSVEEIMHVENSSVVSLLRNNMARKSVLSSVMLHAGQQLSGIRAVIFYPKRIFEEKDNPDAYSALIGFNLVLGTLISMFVVDRLGRKKMLICSLAPVICSLVVLSAKIQDVLGIFSFILGYSMGLGPIPWFITGEIFPEEYKKAGNLVSVSANWISTYLVALVFDGAYRYMNARVFLVFAGLCSLLLMYVILFFRETRGRKADFIQ